MQNLHICFIATIFYVVVAFAPNYAYVDDRVSFTGTIKIVEGQRLKIVTDKGKRVWVTTEEPISKNIIGQNISGTYLLIGDTHVLITPINNGNNQ